MSFRSRLRRNPNSKMVGSAIGSDSTIRGRFGRLGIAVATLMLLWSISPAIVLGDGNGSNIDPEKSAMEADRDGYRTPDPAIVELIDAPETPMARFGPRSDVALLMAVPTYPSIEELAEEELGLAGIRFLPRLHIPSRLRPSDKIKLLDLETGSTRAIDGLPADLKALAPSWSPSGNRLSVVHLTDEGAELWVVDIEEAKARRLLGPVLHAVARLWPAWLDDDTLIATVIATTLPEGRSMLPPAPRAPRGPAVQDSAGEKAAAWTYQDLLDSQHAEDLFEHHLTSQLVRIDLEGKSRPLGDPALFVAIEASPDGGYLLVETLHRPFSYLVPAFRFPMRSSIWTRDGQPVTTIHDRPLQESVPLARGSVPTGRRSITWRLDVPSTLVWVEALDGGDAGAEAEKRDRVHLLEAPFDGQPTVLADLDMRFGQIDWGRGDLALVSGWWWKTRMEKTWLVQPDVEGSTPRLIEERSWQDRYSDPGQPTFEVDARGSWLLQTSADGKSIFRIGAGASAEGDRPFVDRVNIESGDATRLFRSSAPYYERPVRVLDDEGERILTRRESKTEPPGYFIRDLEADTSRALIRFPHPTPQLLGMHKELVKYERADGLELSGTLYTPPGYDAANDGPLPMLMWAYPSEFKSADAAAQVSGSPHRFDRVGWASQLFWLTRGYAVLDDPSMPVIGEGDVEPNDSFRAQLVANAKAAVDAMAERGIAKPGHIAIGGHSYGAFMTANLLAHSDLFAAGIARSGAYNRTLTPFGFQNEERTFWQAPEIYFGMSPFMHADKVDEPILLIHGANDNNPGTYPIQSERFFTALKSHGAVARLVMLPLESHGYRARESILHMLWETERWLDRYVAFPTAVDGVAGEVEEIAPADTTGSH